MGYYSSFVVKLWVHDDRRMIKGHVQHVGTQESRHFLTFDKMVEFMLDHLDPPPNHWAEPQEDIGLSALAQDWETSHE